MPINSIIPAIPDFTDADDDAKITWLQKEFHNKGEYYDILNSWDLSVQSCNKITTGLAYFAATVMTALTLIQSGFMVSADRNSNSNSTLVSPFTPILNYIQTSITIGVLIILAAVNMYKHSFATVKEQSRDAFSPSFFSRNPYTTIWIEQKDEKSPHLSINV